MNLFLSWSGKASQAAATALRDWFPLIINAVRPWMSTTDIDAGARWSPSIQAQLEETNFGIVFVTRSNVAAPWLLFEAGALAKTLQDTYVCPYLIDFQPAQLPSGPLTQFQAKVADRQGTFELVQTVNKALASGAVSDDHLATVFDRFWPDLEKKLAAIPKDDSPSPPRTSEDMLQEALTILRRLDRKGEWRASIDTSSWPVGEHRIIVQALDSSGHKSAPQETVFHVVDPGTQRKTEQ